MAGAPGAGFSVLSPALGRSWLRPSRFINQAIPVMLQPLPDSLQKTGQRNKEMAYSSDQGFRGFGLDILTVGQLDQLMTEAFSDACDWPKDVREASAIVSGDGPS